MHISLDRYRQLLATYLRPQRGKVILLGVLLLSSIGLQLLTPQILRAFIDTAVAGGTVQTLLIIAIAFLVTGLVNQGLTALVTYIGADIGWTATNMLRADLARHVLQLDMPFHNEHTPGELIERLDGDITALATFFSQFVVRILGSVLLLVGVLALIFREEWRAGLILTLFALGALAVLNLTRDSAVSHVNAEREATATVFGFLEERLAGLRDIRANGAGDYVMLGFFKVTRHLFHTARAAWMARGWIWVMMMGLFTFGFLLAFGLGAYFYQVGAISLGTAYLFFQYTEMLRGPLEQITQQMQELQKAGASIIRVQQLLDLHPTIQDGQGSTPPPGPLGVEFDGIAFAYSDRERALDNISFQLEPGRVLGLLGRTGSGKTTLTRLLFRLYDPTEGTIRLGGVPTQVAPLHGLRRRIAMVTQEVQLFHASVRDNLTFFDETIPIERIEEVVRDLGMGDWLASLPNGLETMLEPGAQGLSAGEAQLLALGRVFLADPGLVVLDEPSSRLDPATERLIERAVDKLLANRTGIIIAHRLDTVQRADNIMILEEGRISEYGCREQLAANPNSHFARLLQTGLSEALA